MRKKPAPAVEAPPDNLAVAIEYIGPPGQESPVFGPLVAGTRYQTNETFAAYLVAKHPDYWQRPDGN